MTTNSSRVTEKMDYRKRVLFLLFSFGVALLCVSALAYWYYLQQWVETRDLFHSHFRNTAYLLMVLGVACIIFFFAIFTRLPHEKPYPSPIFVKKCLYCDKTLFEDMNFCPYCGKNQNRDKQNRGQ